jgi:hypothetical protein
MANAVCESDCSITCQRLTRDPTGGRGALLVTE